MNNRKHFLQKFIKYFFLSVAVIATVYPLYWMVFAGTYGSSELIHFVFRWLPGDKLAENFKELQDSFNMIKVIWNTVYVSVVGTTLSLIVNLMMGYAFAKYNFRFKKNDL